MAVTAGTDDAGLFWVADIIEDLISHHGHRIASRLETELRGNARLRRAFVSVVPGNPDPELENRLINLRDEIQASG